VKVVFLTDFYFFIDELHRPPQFHGLMLALERPDWDVWVVFQKGWWDDAERVKRLAEVCKVKVPSNFHAYSLFNVDGKQSDDLWDMLEGDVLILGLNVSHIGDGFADFFARLKDVRRKFSKVFYLAYDSWEGWASLWGREKDMRLAWEREALLAELADAFLAVSPQLCVWLSRRYDLKQKVFWMPNAYAQVLAEGVGAPNFRKPFVALLLTCINRLKIFDDALRAAAAAFPQVTFIVLTGSYFFHHLKLQSSYYGNLYYIEERGSWTFNQLRQRATFFIVFPHAGLNVFSYMADPTKWYVYHAHRRPIVSVGTPHHARMPEVYPYTVCHYNLKEAVGEMLRKIEEGEFGDLKVKPTHDWRHRAQVLAAIIEERWDDVYGFAEKGDWKLINPP